MPRPQLHTTDAMLDAARDLLLEAGSWSATMEAIAQASGAPTGSLYHRFGSRDELIARLWVRAVHRSQAAFISAVQQDDAREAAMAAALSIPDFCDEHPADAQLLVAFRREDLIRSAEGTLAKELAEVNEPVRRAVIDLARRLYGRRTRAAVERTLLAVFDLPYGAVRRHLIAGDPLPTNLRADLALAVRAVLAQ
jgi:AcrR family transcriptional regulator